MRGAAARVARLFFDFANDMRFAHDPVLDTRRGTKSQRLALHSAAMETSDTRE